MKIKIKNFLICALLVVGLGLVYNYSLRLFFPGYNVSTLPAVTNISASLLPYPPSITAPTPIDNFFTTNATLEITGIGYPLSTLYVQEHGVTVCQTQVEPGEVETGGIFSCTATYGLGEHTFEVFVRTANLESEHVIVHGYIDGEFIITYPPIDYFSSTNAFLPLQGITTVNFGTVRMYENGALLGEIPIVDASGSGVWEFIPIVPWSYSTHTIEARLCVYGIESSSAQRIFTIINTLATPTETPQYTLTQTATETSIVTTATPDLTTVGTTTATPSFSTSTTPFSSTPTSVITQTPTRTPKTSTPTKTPSRTKTPLPENDYDQDGIEDDDEKLYGTDPYDADTDDDGLSDGEEVYQYHTNPSNPDTDGDSLNDYQEIKTYHTDPLLKDTDKGGVDDGTEIKEGTDPLDPNTALVQGIIFEDSNKNNVLDDDEKRLAGITIELHSNIVQTMKTDEQGNFIFTRVSPGDHYLTLSKELLQHTSSTFQPVYVYGLKENDTVQINLGLSTTLVIDILPKTGNDIQDSWLVIILLFLALLLCLVILLDNAAERKRKNSRRHKLTESSP